MLKPQLHTLPVNNPSCLQNWHCFYLSKHMSVLQYIRSQVLGSSLLKLICCLSLRASWGGSCGACYKLDGGRGFVWSLKVMRCISGFCHTGNKEVLHFKCNWLIKALMFKCTVEIWDKLYLCMALNVTMCEYSHTEPPALLMFPLWFVG